MSSPHVVPRSMTTTPERMAADRAYRRAWWSLALCPVALVVAFLVGEGLFAMLGGDASDPASRSDSSASVARSPARRSAAGSTATCCCSASPP